jgi:MFS family permease
VLSALKPLRSPNFRLLFASRVTSTMGDWLDFVAVLVLVSVVWKQGATGLAMVSIAVALPNLAAPFVGVLVDRYPPRAVMVGADLARAAITLAMVVAPGVWVLAALLAVRSVAAVAFVPASQAVIKRTVTANSLVQANASMQVVSQALKVAGPAVGGALLAVAAPTTVIAVNAATFLASAAILVGLRVAGSPDRPARSPYLAELGEGLRFIRRSPALLLVVTALGGTVFLTFLYDSMLALVIPGLGLDRSYIGYMISAVGVGGVAGAAVIAQWGAAVRPFLLVGVGQLLVGAFVALIGIGGMTAAPVPGWVWLLVAALLGCAAAGVLVGFPTIVQTTTPDHLIGRTWTAIGAVPTVLRTAAPAIGAALLAAMGVGRLFVLSGTGLVLLSLVTLVGQRRVRRAEATRARSPETVPETTRETTPATTVAATPAATTVPGYGAERVR